MNILLTGGSGFLGSSMLPLLVQDTKITSIALLMRGSRKESASERLSTLIAKIFREGDRKLAQDKLTVIEGDLIASDLGISPEDHDRLLKTCTHILHIGASTDFAAPLAESRLINVEGTRKILDFALAARKDGVLERFDYVSTAFVAGIKPGYVTEDDLDRDQKFANAYEQSKFEAELLVREYRRFLPTTIIRPSIVVGDSRNGFTPHFKVLYWPLQLLAKNLLPFIPCRRSARLDIVPVDFVAISMYKILISPQSVGKTIYLTAGMNQAIRIDEFLRDAFATTNIQRRPLIPLWVFKIIRHTPLRRLLSDHVWQTVELAAVYSCYLAGTGVFFNNQKSVAYLSTLGSQPAPSWNTYAHKILEFCTESRWGRKLKLSEVEYRNPLPTFAKSN